MQRDVMEPIVGGLVLLIAAAFAWFAYTTTGLGGRQGYEIGANFDRVGGLSTGSDVRMSGVKIGTVTALALDPKTYLADVRFSVGSTIEVPDDSVAQITSEGLLGSQYLNIVPGASDTMVKPGGRLKYSQAPVDLMQLLGKFMFSLGDQPQGGGSGGASQQQPAGGAKPTH
jgi:phospholipid/cholesterol/gamma-HCH transport system substrate-binding protein